MTPSAFAALPPGTLFHERYRVVRGLKAGGMGAVYEVVDEVTGGRRALKLMLPGALDEPRQRARFAREARVTGAIESDHLVQVFDAGVDAGSTLPFLVMELLRGEELHDLSARRGPLPPAEALLYLTQVARALEKTHAASIVHRDLKPSNLFVTRRDDGTECVKILDFGLAKVVAGALATQPTTQAGTPLYMAPEQIVGSAALGPGTDVYALGHVAYALLAGEPYWAKEAREGSAFALFQAIVRGPLEAPSERAARRGVALPPSFDAWFRAVTAAEAGRRPGAAAAVARLAEALDPRAPSARPAAPSAASRLPGPAADRKAAGRPPPAEGDVAPEAPADAPAPDGKEALKVVAAQGHPLLGRCFPLDRSPVRLGRAGHNHVVLDHPDVADAHASLRRVADGWALEGREWPAQPVLLQRGGRFIVGPFVFKLVDFANELERDGRKRRRSFSTLPLELVLADAFPRAIDERRPLSVLRFELARPESIERKLGQDALSRALEGMATALWRLQREAKAVGADARLDRVVDGVIASRHHDLFLVLPATERAAAEKLAPVALGRLRERPLRVSPAAELSVRVRAFVASLEPTDRSWRDLLARLLGEHHETDKRP